MKHRTISLMSAFLITLLVVGSIGTTALAAQGSRNTPAKNTFTTVSMKADADTNTETKKTRGEGKGALRGRGKGIHVDVISVASAVLGQTNDEVKEAVKNGKVGDLILAADKVDAFKTVYLETAKTKLDEAVAAELLTQEQADEKYAAEQAKMADYDGNTHLCGGTDHRKMSRDKTTSDGV